MPSKLPKAPVWNRAVPMTRMPEGRVKYRQRALLGAIAEVGYFEIKVHMGLFHDFQMAYVSDGQACQASVQKSCKVVSFLDITRNY